MKAHLANCYLSRHGIWYFRLVIPSKVVSTAGVRRREVRRSLRTRCRREALKRAAYWRVRFDALFKAIMSDNYHDISEELEDQILAELEASTSASLLGIEPGIFASEAEGNIPPTEEALRREARGRLEFRAIKVQQELEEERRLAILRSEARKMELERGLPIGSLMTEEEKTAPVLVSEAIQAYMARVMLADGHMSNRAKNRYLSSFRYFMGLVGDRPLQRISPQVGAEFYDLMLRSAADVFKKNRISNAEDPCATLPMNVFFESDGARINADGAKDKLLQLDKFVTWAFSEYGISKGFDSLSDAILAPKQYAVERSDSKRKVLTDEQAKSLLQLESIRGFIEHPTNSQKFWMPAIMAYSGCRNSEAVWLTPNGIQKDADTGIYCFVFCDELTVVDGEDVLLRKVKNPNSKRKVPIHSQLLEWRILDHWEKAKRTGQAYLFNARPPGMEDSVISNLSTAVTKALKELGVYEKGKVVTYSLRHRFINKLSEHGLAQPEIAYFVGHFDQADKAALVNTTEKYYLKNGSMDDMQRIVELIP